MFCKEETKRREYEKSGNKAKDKVYNRENIKY
jgi:hypothetical protein